MNCECGCGTKIQVGGGRRWAHGHNPKRGPRLGDPDYPDPNPSGLCMCGCGGVTAVSLKTNTRVNRYAGRHMRFITGHSSRLIEGAKSSQWKGGRILDDQGYARVRIGEAGDRRYVKEHRHAMEQKLGRALRPEENVHHINGVRTDNRPENLELWTKSQPCGQRVEDKVRWAVEFLSTYAPNALSKEPLQLRL